MSKVAIITDSTSYIPANMLQSLPVSVVPLQVIFGHDVFYDNVTIHPEEFYTRLQTNKVNPSTSQPSPEAFKHLYLKLLDDGYDVLTIVISSKLSGTMDSALQAQAELPGAPVEVLDTWSTSMAMGYLVLTVARAAAQGATLHECKTLAEMGKEKIGALFTVSTLEYLHRGGRIGGAAAFLGTTLDLKPILTLKEGKIEAMERVRTLSKASDRLVDIFLERANGHKTIRLGFLHAKAKEEATALMEKVHARIPSNMISESILAEVSPVIGTHTGPGTIGIAYMLGM